MEKGLQQLTARIVAAYLGKNNVAAQDISSVIQTVYSSLNNLSKAPTEAPAEEQKPAVPIRKSVSPDAIVCLECGKKQKMLRRHLASEHDLTPEDYRAKWSLPREYPMTAPNYAAARSELAKAAGLGTMRSRRNSRAK